MPDLKQNQLYGEVAKTISSLGRPSGPNLPKINTGTSQTSLSNISGSGMEKLQNLGSITTPYGGSTKFESYHPGIDIANKEGTVIPSLTEGTVVEKQTGLGSTSSPSFGNYIIVKTPDNKYVRYSHLQNAWVPLGKKVSPGQPLGTMGTSGSVYSLSGNSGSHTDLRIWELFQNQKKYLNPLDYLKNV